MTTTHNLTKLPAPSSAPASHPSGVVKLFRDDNWQSSSLQLLVSHYQKGERQAVPSSGFDNATFIALNWPIGTVMTLMDNIAPVEAGYTVTNLRKCDRCVDLVGTGQTEAVDLRVIRMNDCVSSFFGARSILN